MRPSRAGGPSGPSGAVKLNAAGMAALAEGRRGEAENLFTSSAAADPANISAYLNLAVLLLADGLNGRAAAVCAAARGRCNRAQLGAAGRALEEAEVRARRGIKRRLLLVSLADTIENRLFELSFLSAAGERGEVQADLAVSPTVFGLVRPPFSFTRLTVCRPGEIFALPPEDSYDETVFVDFPSAAFVEPFAGLLAAKGRKSFVCLHLLPKEGDSAGADLAEFRRLFSGLRRLYLLEHDRSGRQARLGVPAAALRRYMFSVNTDYYRPSGSEGRYIFSAGNAARDYGPLVRASARLGLELRIFTDLDLPVSPGLKVLRLNGAHEAMRREMAGALAVAVPFIPAPGRAANSIVTMAMSSGKPVLTCACPELRRLIDDGRNGFLYSPGRPRDLERKLRVILALGRRGRRRVGLAARETALSGASYALLARRVLSGK